MDDTQLQALIARNPNHPKYGVPVPLILICNVTGKETKYTAPEYIKGKLDAAGGLEALLKSYKCKGAGKGEPKSPGAGASKSKPPASDVEGVDPTIPKSRQTWRGTAVTMEVKAKDEEPSAPVDTIHRLYVDDEGVSHAYHPRQNPEQLKENVHDHRRHKDRPVDGDGLFPETIKLLRSVGIQVKT